MTEPAAPKKRSREAPPPPEPIPGLVGRPEVSKGIFGDFFKRKAKKSEVRGSA